MFRERRIKGAKNQGAAQAQESLRPTLRANKCFPHNFSAGAAWVVRVNDQAFSVWRPSNESIGFDTQRINFGSAFQHNTPGRGTWGNHARTEFASEHRMSRRIRSRAAQSREVLWPQIEATWDCREEIEKRGMFQAWKKGGPRQLSGKALRPRRVGMRSIQRAENVTFGLLKAEG